MSLACDTMYIHSVVVILLYPYPNFAKALFQSFDQVVQYLTDKFRMKWIGEELERATATNFMHQI